MFKPHPRNQKEQRSASQHLWLMRWFFIYALCFLTVLSVILPAIVFYLTRDPMSFSCVSVTIPLVYIWRHSVKFLFPVKGNDPRRKMVKAHPRAEGATRKVSDQSKIDEETIKKHILFDPQKKLVSNFSKNETSSEV